MVADYNAALAGEAELLKAVFAVSNSSLISITFNSASRQVVGETPRSTRYDCDR